MLVGCLVLWLPDFMTLHSPILWGNVSMPHRGVSLLCLLLTIANGVGLSSLLFYLYVTRTRSVFSIVIYFLTISCFPALHTNVQAQLCVFLYMLVVGCLMGMYKDTKAVLPAYNLGLLFPFLVMLHPMFLFLLPFLWGAMIIIRAFSLRTLGASVFGVLTTYVLVLWVCHFRGEAGWTPWNGIHFSWVDSPWGLWVWLLWCLFAMVVTLLQYARILSYSIKNRMIMNAMSLLVFITFVLSLLSTLAPACLVCNIATWLLFVVQWFQADNPSRFAWVYMLLYIVLVLGIYTSSVLGYGMA